MGLTSFSIPEHVVNVGASVFKGCEKLTSVVFYCKSIGNWLNDINSQITSVTFGEGVQEIGNSAFAGFSAITSIDIPKVLKNIGDKAFSGCSALVSITIPDSVISMGATVFEGCINMRTLTVNCKKINNWFSDIKDHVISVELSDNTEEIGSSAFEGFSEMTALTIPKNVKIIRERAFAECIKLSTVIINSNTIASKTYSSTDNFGMIFGSQVQKYVVGDEVTSIGSNAFYGCSGMREITIGKNVKSVGEQAFYGCNNISTLTIACKNIGNWFGDCKTKVTDVWLGNEVEEIGNSAFEGFSALSTLTLPASIRSIGDAAFAKCANLGSIELPENVMLIGDNAFSGCIALTSFNMPNELTSIGKSAFYGCSGLRLITIPSKVMSIGEGAFGLCSELSTVILNSDVIISKSYSASNSVSSLFGPQVRAYVIGDNITSIGANSFGNCNNLSSVTISHSVKSIGMDAFSGCVNLEKVVVEDLSAWCNIAFAGMNSNPITFAHHLLVGGEEVSELLIPNGVSTINNYAFAGCVGLTSVTIPSGVTNVGAEAFSGCNRLNSVHITDLQAWCSILFANSASNPLTYAHRLFLNEEEMTELTIPESVSSIGNYAFSGCSTLSNVSISNTVRTVGESAFQGCTGIKTLSIGSGMTKIESLAFAELSMLEDIYCYAVRYPVTAADAFKDSYLEFVTLHVPEKSVIPYTNHAVWGKAMQIVPIIDTGDDPIYLTLQNAERGAMKMVAQQGKKYSFVIEPQDGWMIHSVCFNDEDVTALLDENNGYTTPELVGDSRLSVVYKQDASTQNSIQRIQQLVVLSTSFGARILGGRVGETAFVYTEDGVLQKVVKIEKAQTDIQLKKGHLYIIEVEDTVVKLRH